MCFVEKAECVVRGMWKGLCGVLPSPPPDSMDVVCDLWCVVRSMVVYGGVVVVWNLHQILWGLGFVILIMWIYRRIEGLVEPLNHSISSCDSVP